MKAAIWTESILMYVRSWVDNLLAVEDSADLSTL